MTRESDAIPDPIGLYLDEIGQVPLLTAEEEVFLAQQIEAGVIACQTWQAAAEAGETLAASRNRELQRAIHEGAAAKEHFINANLRLVVSVAKRYPLPPGMGLLDLVQEGNLGLEHAVDKFDWTKGFKFSTYATWWIRQAIGRGIEQKGNLIRVPGGKAREIRGALREGITLTDEQEVINTVMHPASLDAPNGPQEECTLADILVSDLAVPDRELDLAATQHVVKLALDRLDERPRKAVEARFGLDDGKKKSFREVGEILGVTSEAARRLVMRSVQVLQDNARRSGLDAIAS
jgi:RNA polymerase primary sigma factor